MKFTTKAAYFVFFTSVTLGSVAPLHAQQRRTSNVPMPSYTPPPAPRPRPEPVETPRRSAPENRMPEQRQPENTYNRQARQEEAPRQATERPGPSRAENRPGNNVEREKRPNVGANHPSTTVVRPTVMTPAIRRATTYNTRRGIHIDPAYFAIHYGRGHVFRFPRYSGGVCIGDCGLILFGEEFYFNFNGGWFGIIGPMPGNWAFQTDDLYIDIGDDGNYYLYDAQFPDVAVQLTFVQNIGDDQAGGGDDQSE